MTKHVSAKIKYHFIMRYLKNLESEISIVDELMVTGILKIQNHHHAITTFRRWVNKYQEFGYESLESSTGRQATGRPKKDGPPDPKDLTREELEWFYKKWRDKNWPKDNDAKYREIDEELKNSSSFTKSRLCEIFNVSRQMFNRWKMHGTQSKNKMKPEWEKAIRDMFLKLRMVGGYRRVHMNLVEEGMDISLSTVKRYMRIMGLKSKIRGGRIAKSKKPVNTEHKREDHVKRGFDNWNRYQLITTDITEFWLGDEKVYISLTTDIYNWEIIDLVVGRRKGNHIAIPNILNTFSKIDKVDGQILHSDNGSEYTSIEADRMAKKFGYTQSYSRPGKCQDNRVVEYIIGILKTEYIRIDCNDMNYHEFVEYAKWMMYHYNNIRRQGNLQNKTPHEYAVLRL